MVCNPVALRIPVAAWAAVVGLLSFGLEPVTAAATVPRAASTPIELGVSLDFLSTALAEHRTVNIVLPASYAKDTARRYPVLYLIDGGVTQDLVHVAGVVQLGAIWGRSSEVIVVGIETKDRRRELVGPTRDPALLNRFPTAGSQRASATLSALK